MVKIARDAAERLLLMMLYFKGRDYNCAGILEDSLGRKHPFKSNHVLRNIYHDGLTSTGPWTQWSEYTNHLMEQLTGGPSTAHHPTLIDIIVDLLQGPYARNIISGRNLQQLRKAILLPEEMIKFGESVRKEMACAGCGKSFINGEMTSFRTDGDESAFYCTRCTVPSYAACRLADSTGKYCENAGEVNSTVLTKLLNKSDCGDHQTSKGKSKEAVADDIAADVLRQQLVDLAAAGLPPAQPGDAQWVDVGQAQAPIPQAQQHGAFVGNDPQARYQQVNLPGGRVEIRRVAPWEDNPFRARPER